MHEHVAAAIVRLDETVAALAIEELHHTLLRHLETPTPQLAAGPTLGGAAWTFREGIGLCRPPSLRHCPPQEAEVTTAPELHTK
jgi:hypothetical protein